MLKPATHQNTSETETEWRPCESRPWDHTDVNIKATVESAGVSVKPEYLCYYSIKKVACRQSCDSDGAQNSDGAQEVKSGDGRDKGKATSR